MRLSVALLLALLASCGTPGSSGPPIVPGGGVAPTGGGEPGATPPVAFAERIDDEAMWLALAARPNSQVFAHTEVVKFLFDLAYDRVYFPQTERWPIHFYFARDYLGTSDHPIQGHAEFNTQEYRRPDRRFLMGALVHYRDGDLFTLELAAGDNMDPAQTRRTFERVKSVVYFGDRLRFRPRSPLHEANARTLGDAIPVITANEVLANLRYQPLTLGVAYGYVRIVPADFDRGTALPNQILVARGVPEDLPVVQALVTSELQAPLAHVGVLSQNRRTPNMGLRDAADFRAFELLDGQLVRLEVGPQDFTLAPTTMIEAERAWAASRPARPLRPTLDATAAELREVTTLRFGDIATVGAKAAQLGEVASFSGRDPTPGGFAIPFHYYLAHLSQHGLQAGITSMLASAPFRNSIAEREARLGELRRILERLPVDRALVDRVAQLVGRYAGRKVIFRSSTNAEDLVGFNGAGLYDSIVVDANPTREQIESAIRGVWASVWTLRGFEERDWYRIDHSRVAMGILVQPFVDAVIGNGVAITANPFTDVRPGVFINVQTRGGSVTDAGTDVPEQLLVYTWSEEYEPEILTRSSRNGGAPILEERDVLALTDMLVRLHQHFVPHYDGRANAVDVEFLVTERHEIVIVQARPFLVNYSAHELL